MVVAARAAPVVAVEKGEMVAMAGTPEVVVRAVTVVMAVAVVLVVLAERSRSSMLPELLE